MSDFEQMLSSKPDIKNIRKAIFVKYFIFRIKQRFNYEARKMENLKI